MPKYTVTIEFETDKPLKFPTDAVVLNEMEVQLESLVDGDHGTKYDVRTVKSTIKEE